MLQMKCRCTGAQVPQTCPQGKWEELIVFPFTSTLPDLLYIWKKAQENSWHLRVKTNLLLYKCLK